MSSEITRLRSVCLQHLEHLQSAIPDLHMAVVSSADGFPVAILANEAPEARKAAAMAAALDGLCKSMAKEFSLSTHIATSLECEHGVALCRQICGSKENLVLLLVFGESLTYGHAIWLIKNTVQQMEISLAGLLEPPL